MFRSFRLGSAFGIPLYLHPTFALLPLYVLATTRGEGTVRVLLAQAVLFTVFGCVLLHELGHALMARVFGIATRDVTLYPIGGVARLDGTGSRPFEEIAIALAGPAVNLVIFLLLLPVVFLLWAGGVLGAADDPIGSGGSTAMGFVAHWLAMVCIGNLGLLVFNLIPAFPMDGGRVLRATLSLFIPRLDATRIAVGLALVAAAGLALLGFFLPSPGLVFVALFVAFAGQMELWILKRREAQQAAEQVVPDHDVRRLDEEESAGFTGMAWDQRRGVWVRWVNGRVSE